MDATGFDQLAKVTAGASRRHAFRLLAGGALASHWAGDYPRAADSTWFP